MSQSVSCTEPSGHNEHYGCASASGCISSSICPSSPGLSQIEHESAGEKLISDLSGQKMPTKAPEIATSHDVLQPLKQLLLASCDVLLSLKFEGSAKRAFHTR